MGSQMDKNRKIIIVLAVLLVLVGGAGIYFAVDSASQRNALKKAEDKVALQTDRELTDLFRPYLGQLLIDIPFGMPAVFPTSYYFTDDGVFYKFISLSDCTSETRGYKGRYTVVDKGGFDGYTMTLNYEKQVAVPKISCAAERHGGAVYDTSKLVAAENISKLDVNVAFTDWGGRQSVLIGDIQRYAAGQIEDNDEFGVLKDILDR